MAPLDLAQLLPRFLSRLERHPGAADSPEGRESRAEIDMAVSLRETPRERREFVLRNSPKFHTVAFAEELLALAAQVAGDSPAEAIELLDAFEVLADLPAFDESEVTQAAIAELSAWAMTRRAVNLTKLGRLDDAALVLEIGEEFDFTSVEGAGEYHEARAHLAAVRQSLEEALGELAEARELYESIGDEHLVGRVLVAQAFAYGEIRDFKASVACLLDACVRVDSRRDPRLALALCFNLARALHDAGRSDEALETIELTREFVQATARRLDRLHLRWLEASLLASRGYFSTAATAYLEVASGFGELDLAIEASEVTLEAVESFAVAGRTRELLPLLMVAERVLRVHGFTAERLAAWLALQSAVASQVVTAAVIAAARSATQAQ